METAPCISCREPSKCIVPSEAAKGMPDDWENMLGDWATGLPCWIERSWVCIVHLHWETPYTALPEVRSHWHRLHDNNGAFLSNAVQAQSHHERRRTCNVDRFWPCCSLGVCRIDREDCTVWRQPLAVVAERWDVYHKYDEGSSVVGDQDAYVELQIRMRMSSCSSSYIIVVTVPSRHDRSFEKLASDLSVGEVELSGVVPELPRAGPRALCCLVLYCVLSLVMSLAPSSKFCAVCCVLCSCLSGWRKPTQQMWFQLESCPVCSETKVHFVVEQISFKLLEHLKSWFTTHLSDSRKEN